MAGLMVALCGPLPAQLADVTQPGDPIIPTANNGPGWQHAAYASIDNEPTNQYIAFDKLNAGFTVTPGRGATIVVGLTLTSGNDGAERDPASYTLEGSNDGTNFVAISSGSVPPFPARFHKLHIMFPQHTNSFTSYRLIFPTVANPATAHSMDISEVELLAHLLQEPPGPCSTNAAPLIRKQPADTPVLLGARALFRVGLTGPWRLQWYRNDVEIPGATTSTYTTPPVTAADDGARYRARVISPSCYTDSDEVLLNVFTPLATESIGLNFTGDFGATGPFEMLPEDITGLHPQAYWNNLRRMGSLPHPLNSSNQPHPTITVQWATSGEWRAGVGDDDATQRMFEGMATSVATNEASAQNVVFSGVPAGDHSLLLYTVQVPLEFFNMDFQAITFHADGVVKSVQQRFIRPQNGDEYNASPGFHLVTSDTPATRAVGNTLRFDHLQPEDGRIQIRFFSPDRTQPPPPANPVRGPGLNGLQLLLYPAGVRTRVAQCELFGKLGLCFLCDDQWLDLYRRAHRGPKRVGDLDSAAARRDWNGFSCDSSRFLTASSHAPLSRAGGVGARVPSQAVALFRTRLGRREYPFQDLPVRQAGGRAAFA